MTYNFHSSFKHMHLSFKSVCSREDKGVICYMTYKVPYIIAKILPSAEPFKKGCCQLQAKVCARSTG